MGCDTIFTGTMHFPCTNLDFERFPGRPDQCIMQRLIHVGLGHGDIVLESSWHRFIHGMDDTQHCVTVTNGIYDSTNGKQVINLIQCFLLVDHLFINTEKVFAAAFDLAFDARFFHFFTNFFDNVRNECFTFNTFLFNLCSQIKIGFGIQILKAQILHFRFDLGNTQTMCQRRIDIHGFLCFFPLFFRRHIVQCPHVMQTVGQFDQNNTDILCHCQKHLTIVFCLNFFFCGVRQLTQFCNTVNQNGDFLTENT